MKKRFGSWMVRLGAAAALVGCLAGTASADGGGDMPSSRPILLAATGLSQNWAGWATYAGLADLPQAGAVSHVSGEWVVPAVSCGAADTDSSVWVGIDGLKNGYVEQIGTEQSCRGGQAVYSAWWEMYPAPKVAASVAVKPGDRVRGEVRYLGFGRFALSIVNETTNRAFSTTQTQYNAPRSSAEWVVEAPWKDGVLPLANFGEVTIGEARATVNGRVGGIPSGLLGGGLLNVLRAADSQMAEGLAIKAQTGRPSADGESFKVTWRRN